MQVFYQELFNKLAPLFKQWVKEALLEFIPDLVELQSSVPPSTHPPKEYLSPNEVSKLLGISIPTLRKYTRRGVYKAYKVGERKVQYKRSEIEKALQEQRINTRIKKGLNHE